MNPALYQLSYPAKAIQIVKDQTASTDVGRVQQQLPISAAKTKSPGNLRLPGPGWALSVSIVNGYGGIDPRQVDSVSPN